MNFYVSSNELYHHGILGMKWGIRRYQPYPPGKKGRFVGKKKHKEISGNILNVEMWGKDKKHNTLYISGVSGSGKSTLSKSLGDSETEIIHLDKYLEYTSDPGEKHSASFDSHLSKTVPNFRNLTKKDGFKSREDRWKVIDALGDEIEKFSEESYEKGKKVIVEGLQLSDDTIFPDKRYFQDKCVVVLTADTSDAVRRAIIRDLKRDVQSVDGLIDKMETAIYSVKKTVSSAKERAEWYEFFNKRLNELSDSLVMEDGKNWLNSKF